MVTVDSHGLHGNLSFELFQNRYSCYKHFKARIFKPKQHGNNRNRPYQRAHSHCHNLKKDKQVIGS